MLCPDIQESPSTRFPQTLLSKPSTTQGQILMTLKGEAFWEQWEKKKILGAFIFLFSHSVFYSTKD